MKKQQSKVPKGKKASKPKTSVRSSAPAASGTRTVAKAASITSSTKGGVRIRHREMVCAVVSPANVLMSFRTNPANSGLFPWLSTVASRYEKYSFHSVKLAYENRCPTSTTGQVVLGFDPDPDDVVFDTPDEDTRRSLMAIPGTVCGPLWQGFTMHVPADTKERFVEHETGEINPDARWTSPGIAYLGVFYTDSTAPVSYGDLFVEYDVSLSVPCLDRVETMAIPTVEGTLSNDADVTGDVADWVDSGFNMDDGTSNVPMPNAYTVTPTNVVGYRAFGGAIRGTRVLVQRDAIMDQSPGDAPFSFRVGPVPYEDLGEVAVETPGNDQFSGTLLLECETMGVVGPGGVIPIAPSTSSFTATSAPVCETQGVGHVYRADSQLSVHRMKPVVTNYLKVGAPNGGVITQYVQQIVEYAVIGTFASNLLYRFVCTAMVQGFNIQRLRARLFPSTTGSLRTSGSGPYPSAITRAYLPRDLQSKPVFFNVSSKGASKSTSKKDPEAAICRVTRLPCGVLNSGVAPCHARS